jgi:ferredoxin
MTEDEFRELCVRCGNCMRACPTGGLQPALSQAGLDGVFTPVLVPQIGWCEQQCNACSRVCPTGALRPHTIEEKADIKLGLASVDPERCLSWQRGDDYKLCLVCVEHCPYQAVVAEMEEGQLRPFVRPDKCVGCGQCEHFCPEGDSGAAAAITVSRLLSI